MVFGNGKRGNLTFPTPWVPGGIKRPSPSLRVYRALGCGQILEAAHPGDRGDRPSRTFCTDKPPRQMAGSSGALPGGSSWAEAIFASCPNSSRQNKDRRPARVPAASILAWSWERAWGGTNLLAEMPTGRPKPPNQPPGQKFSRGRRHPAGKNPLTLLARGCIPLQAPPEHPFPVRLGLPSARNFLAIPAGSQLKPSWMASHSRYEPSSQRLSAI